MKILMVCLGNICRSPLAEGILRSKISEKHTVASAGTISFHEGSPPDKRSTKIAQEHGVDISHQRANYFTEKHLEDFDKIFCMDLKNLEDVLSKAKSEEQRNKVSLIMEEAGVLSDEKIEVPDPYYGDMSDFEKVYQMLDQACEAIAEKYNLK